MTTKKPQPKAKPRLDNSRWTEPISFWAVDANGRFSGWPEPKSVRAEARIIRAMNALAEEEGDPRYPKTEWAYNPELMDDV